MSWRNIRLIFAREARDQLRDRRTLFMIVVLPLLLYPALGIGMVQMMVLFQEQPRTVVILGERHLPHQRDLQLLEGDRFVRNWFELTQEADKLQVIADGPDPYTMRWFEQAADIRRQLAERPAGQRAALLEWLGRADEMASFLERAGKPDAAPPDAAHLLEWLDQAAHFHIDPGPQDADTLGEAALWLEEAAVIRAQLAARERLHAEPRVGRLLSQAAAIREKLGERERIEEQLHAAEKAKDGARLAELPARLHAVNDALGKLFAGSDMQVLILVPDGFGDGIEAMNRRIAEGRSQDATLPDAERPRIVQNSADDKSMVAYRRVKEAMASWERRILKERLRQANLAENLTAPVNPVPVDLAKADELSARAWSKLFPALVVIMAVTGAFYPAIDLAAGEKERGTMETLLICPAGRNEIVMGKFFTVMMFSMATAILNLLSMGLTGRYMASVAGAGTLEKLGQLQPPSVAALLWVAVLLVPLAALFSALCLALATFARSSKEGQYYLTPLLMVTMGLTFFCLSPGVDITPFYSLMPVVGPALLLKEVLATQGSAASLAYAVPVLLTSIGYSLLALWWAIDQFSREDVLFREAERFELRLWIRHLLRDKDPVPTFAEAGFCFVLIMLLQFGGMKFLQERLAVTRPADEAAAMMQLLMVQQLVMIATPALLMGVILTRSVVRTFRLRLPSWPMLGAAVVLPLVLHPLSLELSLVLQRGFFPPMPPEVMRQLGVLGDLQQPLWLVLLAFAVAPAVCEEIAFRGFILSGFHRTGRAWLAIGLSSLAFGVMHMFPQQVFNAALLGLVLGLLALRSRSLVPCVVFHLIYNALAVLHGRASAAGLPLPEGSPLGWFVMLESDVLRYRWPLLMIAGVTAIVVLRWLAGTPRPRRPGITLARSRPVITP